MIWLKAPRDENVIALVGGGRMMVYGQVECVASLT